MAFIAKPTNTKPVIHYEDSDIVVVEKPHGLPTAPVKTDDTDNLVSFVVENFPKAKSVCGKKCIEYGLLHRLDTDTHGLVVFALTQQAYDFLLSEQDSNKFIKKYTAFCNGQKAGEKKHDEFVIESYFRPFGEKGKKVLPVSKEDFEIKKYSAKKCAPSLYRTTVESVEQEQKDYYKITCYITKGFRHQIRAHLAWINYPIISDRLYNADIEDLSIPLQLHASAVSFSHPSTGERLVFSLRDFFTSETR
ncbi:MAG: RNA pseudouridine synthase [Spirochaetaceae bacterium]|nr:RNA pseudouridine synthase [Spirochaetaceae bacterium]